jgi:hypothetical protein
LLIDWNIAINIMSICKHTFIMKFYREHILSNTFCRDNHLCEHTCFMTVWVNSEVKVRISVRRVGCICTMRACI